MAPPPKDDPVAQFFAKAAEAVGEVTHGAITDVRQKLIQEAWFGRQVTQGEQDVSARLGWTQAQAPAPAAAASPEGAWNDLCGRLAKERSQTPEREPEHDHDFGER